MINLKRRKLLQIGALSLASTGFITTLNKANAQEESITQNTVKSDATPDEALQLLMEGNKRFIEEKSINQNRSLTRIKQVAKKQTPFATILGCADSRVPVEIIFDQGFGDLFVVRNAGNIATDEEIGSIEFGSLVLGSKVILVLGHDSCGAVISALAGKTVPGSIQSVLDYIKPAINNLTPEQKKDADIAIKANVKQQINRLQKSPVLSQLITDNKLKIVGGYYDLDTAQTSLIS